VNWTDLV